MCYKMCLGWRQFYYLPNPVNFDYNHIRFLLPWRASRTSLVFFTSLFMEINGRMVLNKINTKCVFRMKTILLSSISMNFQYLIRFFVYFTLKTYVRPTLFGRKNLVFFRFLTVRSFTEHSSGSSAYWNKIKNQWSLSIHHAILKLYETSVITKIWKTKD